MLSLIEAASRPDYPAEIALVLSNRPDAAGLARAGDFGIETVALDHKLYPDRPSFDAALHAILTSRAIELVCLAGFMRILTDELVARWPGRMINIHPSLLPAYKGLDTHARALAAADDVHGCTVHFVVPELDSGPIIAQARIPILPNDTEATLAARVLAEEHRLYPEALRLVASGEVRLEGSQGGGGAMGGFSPGALLG